MNELLNTNILLQIYVCYDNFETLVKSGGQVGIELRSQKIFCERKYLEVFFWKLTLPADGGERLVKEISELLPHEFFSKILTLSQTMASVFCKKGSIRFIAMRTIWLSFHDTNRKQTYYFSSDFHQGNYEFKIDVRTLQLTHLMFNSYQPESL